MEAGRDYSGGCCDNLRWTRLLVVGIEKWLALDMFSMKTWSDFLIN